MLRQELNQRHRTQLLKIKLGNKMVEIQPTPLGVVYR